MHVSIGVAVSAPVAVLATDVTAALILDATNCHGNWGRQIVE